MATAGASAPAVAVDVPDFRLKVVAHDSSHLSWSAASRLAEAAGENGLKVQLELASKPGEQTSDAAAPDLLVMPLRGGSFDDKGSIEVLVEVRDPREHRRCIGAWCETKRDAADITAFERAYEKATAHAIIQMLPAVTWRPWIGTRVG